ncbi:MAG: M28 family peptidase, partial [Bacteroidota bacterium]
MQRSRRTALFSAFLNGIGFVALLFHSGAGTPIVPFALILAGFALALVSEDIRLIENRSNALERYVSRVHFDNGLQPTSATVPGNDDSAISLGGNRTFHEQIPGIERELRNHLARIVGERHVLSSRQHHDRVGTYIVETMQAWGWEVEKQPVKGPHGWGTNIIARRQGNDPSKAPWIVGAHYDTVQGTQGADDNGIAVAGLLVLARLFAESNLTAPIWIVAWDFEEIQSTIAGGLLGSTVMARELKRQNAQIRGVLCLEMI